MYSIQPSLVLVIISNTLDGFNIRYIWRGAFSVARFGKLGDARASTRGTSDRSGSTFLFVYAQIEAHNRQEGAIDRKMIINEKTYYFEIHVHRSVFGNEHGCECRSH